jgi:hypothetical protein
MAQIEARGFVKDVKLAESAKGPYAKFTLAVQQKRRDKDKNDIKETLYFKCVDFDPKDVPSEDEYVGVKGYVTLTRWGTDSKGGVNVDVTVQSYEKLPQKSGGGGKPTARKDDAAPPSDPFKLSQDKP